MPTSDPQGDALHAAVSGRFRRVATAPDQERKFPVGPESAKKLGYDPAKVDALPFAVTESFCGGKLVVIKGGSTPLDQAKRVQVTTTLITSYLSQANHIIVYREEPTGQSIGTPRRQQDH